jgi:hypothetical protein
MTRKGVLLSRFGGSRDVCSQSSWLVSDTRRSVADGRLRHAQVHPQKGAQPIRRVDCGNARGKSACVTIFPPDLHSSSSLADRSSCLTSAPQARKSWSATAGPCRRAPQRSAVAESLLRETKRSDTYGPAPDRKMLHDEVRRQVACDVLNREFPIVWRSHKRIEGTEVGNQVATGASEFRPH